MTQEKINDWFLGKIFGDMDYLKILNLLKEDGRFNLEVPVWKECIKETNYAEESIKELSK